MKSITRSVVAITMLSLGACSSSGGMGTGSGGQGGGAGGATGWNGHLIQGTDIAIGGYALAVSDDDHLTFKPEPGSDEIEAWRSLLPEATYDLSINPPGGTAAGHYRVTRKEDTLAFDVTLDAANTGAAVSSSSDSASMLVGVKKPGATRFKMIVTCTGVMVTATGEAQALVEVEGEDPASGDPLSFCRSSANVPSVPSGGTTGGSVETEADEEGYAVFEYIRALVTATAPGPGVAHAALHLELQFVPQP